MNKTPLPGSSDAKRTVSEVQTKKIPSLKWSEITRTQTRKFETTDDLGYLPMMEKAKKKLVKVGHSQAKAPRTRVSTRQEQVPSPQDSIFFHDWNLWKWAPWAWNVRHTVHTPLPGHCFFQKLMINHHQPSNVGAVGGSAWVSEKMLSLEVYVLWKLSIWRHWRVGFATGGLSPAFKVSLLVEVSGFGAHVLLPICSVCFALLANRSITSSEIINLFKTTAY